MPELSVEHCRHKSHAVLVVKDTAEVVLLDYNSMYRAIPEALTAVDAAIFNKPALPSRIRSASVGQTLMQSEQPVHISSRIVSA